MKYAPVSLLASILLVAGCGDTPPANTTPPPATPTTPATNSQPKRQKSTMETVIGGFTGQTAVEKGKETRAKLEAIGKQKQSTMEEVMP
jgi:hypothetical protein